MEKIELINDYYLEIINNEAEKIENATDIDNINKRDVLKKKVLLICIDFNKIKCEDYKKVLKRFLKIKKKISHRKIEIGKQIDSKKFLGYVINYNKENSKQNDFIVCINAILCDTRYKRYNYCYDMACDYFDQFFYGKNLCEFRDNKCAGKRTTSSVTGCCNHFKVKWLGAITKLVPCEYLTEDHKCGAKCLACKFFTCDTLRKKGVIFRVRDILILDTFFNPIQKYFIRYMVFTPKEKIMKRLMIT